jgi:putative flippase GtrA
LFMEKIKELWHKYHEVIAYLFWGVMTTIVNWIVYTACVRILPESPATLRIFGSEFSSRIFWANVIAWAAAVVFAFFSNKIRVFESRSFAPSVAVPEFLKFAGSRAATGLLESFLVPFLVGCGLDQTVFGIEGSIAKILVSVIVVILNYVFSKLLVFRQKKEA